MVSHVSETLSREVADISATATVRRLGEGSKDLAARLEGLLLHSPELTEVGVY